MSGRREHQTAGVLAGMTVTAYRSRREAEIDQLIEIAGGMLGGWYGSMMPDALEPATSSWHRDFCHSWAVQVSAVKALALVGAWESECRKLAIEYQARCQSEPDPPKRFLYSLAELFWRLVTGLAAGFIAGYSSHLALDALTPRGLPLLARQFC
jgi:LexA-binding, inner membrane-associated putative hydrolase